MADQQHHSNPKKPQHTTRNWIIGIIVVLIVALGGYGYHLYASAHDTVNKTQAPLKTKKNKAATKKADKATKFAKPISLLVMNSGTKDLSASDIHTDTMMVMTLNPEMKKTTLTTVPYNTMAELVGSSDKTVAPINTAYTKGGADMSVSSVSSLINAPIDYYALVNVNGLTKLVDTFGGVDITPTETFSRDGHDFKAGEKMHMDSKTVLSYARKDSITSAADLNTTEHQDRQQQVIMAIFKEAASFKSLTNFKELMKSVQDNMRTNMSFDQMVTVFSKYRGAMDTLKKDTLAGTQTKVGDTTYTVDTTDELQRVSDSVRTSLGLNKKTLKNEETKLNKANKDFNFGTDNATGYKISVN